MLVFIPKTKSTATETRHQMTRTDFIAQLTAALVQTPNNVAIAGNLSRVSKLTDAEFAVERANSPYRVGGPWDATIKMMVNDVRHRQRPCARQPNK